MRAIAICAVVLVGCDRRPVAENAAAGVVNGEAGVSPHVAGDGLARTTARGERNRRPQSEGAQQASAAASENAGARRETWESIHLGEGKVGHIHTLEEPVRDDGRALVRIKLETRVAIRRGEDLAAIALESTSYETPDGSLVRFEDVDHGAGNRRVKGRVEGSRLALEIEAQGAAESQTLDWDAQVKGFLSDQQTLREKPLRPGESRELRRLEPLFYQIVTMTLQGEEHEEVELPGGRQRLLRIAVRNSLVPEVKTWYWADSNGEVLKTRTDLAPVQTTYRTSRERALADDGSAAVDLALTPLLPVARAIPDPHATVAVTYRLTLDSESPTKLIPSGPTQQVTPDGPHAIRLRVTALRAQSTTSKSPEDGAESDTEPAPAAEYLQPNAILQSDAESIRKLAQAAAGEASEPADIARRLEAWVHQNLRTKNLRLAFAAAADVAERLEGDCTEHAVLLAALARAKGIPSRVAVGLIYLESSPSFGYHMWTEVYVGGRWVGLDGTLGRGGIGAAHIKLGDSSLAGGNALSVFLPVARLLSRLKIEVLEYQHP